MLRCAVTAMLLLSIGTRSAQAQQQWEMLPPTPTLPKAVASGLAEINGVKIWHAEFGRGAPVILLHGGLGNSNYWGLQVRALESRYRVIVMDSRGHGRSTRNDVPYSYHVMAEDVIGLMDQLKLSRAAVVGWSDGAIIGLDLALNHPDRITKLFAFAANSTVDGAVEASAVGQNRVFNSYIARAGKEYEALSPTPAQFTAFLEHIGKMWASEPQFTTAQLASIRTPTWIVDGDHDEVIKRENTLLMAATIPGAGLLIQPHVSHFSFLQDPKQFNSDLLHFLECVPDALPGR